MKKIYLILLAAVFIALPFQTMARPNTENIEHRILPANTTAPTAVTEPTTTASPTVTPSSGGDVNGNAKNWKDKVSAFKSAQTAQKVARLKELANTLIDNRVDLLNNLKTRINSMTTVTATEKATLIADIDKNLTELEALKTKVAAETTVAALKADIQTILQTHRIYSVVAPRDLGQSLAARGQYILGRLTAIEDKIEKLLAAKKTAGLDTASLDSLITQINAKLDDAKAQLVIADAKFKSMTPANTEAAKTARAEGKEAMRKAKQDLKDAHTLLKQVITGLRTLETASPGSSPKATTSPSTSASPTTTPTPTPSTSASAE